MKKTTKKKYQNEEKKNIKLIKKKYQNDKKNIIMLFAMTQLIIHRVHVTL